MKIDDEILINQYGQDIISVDILLNRFNQLNPNQKRNYMNGLLNLIQQSKPLDDDIPIAIQNSKLKVTYTPCVMLKKGLANHLLEKIIALPENELNKALALLLSLFKIAYRRRFKDEQNDPNKWWYWDLSNEKNIEFILSINYLK